MRNSAKITFGVGMAVAVYFALSFFAQAAGLGV